MINEIPITEQIKLQKIQFHSSYGIAAQKNSQLNNEKAPEKVNVKGNTISWGTWFRSLLLNDRLSYLECLEDCDDSEICWKKKKKQKDTKSLLPFTLLGRATMQLSEASRDWLRKR